MSFRQPIQRRCLSMMYESSGGRLAAAIRWTKCAPMPIDAESPVAGNAKPPSSVRLASTAAVSSTEGCARARYKRVRSIRK